jgi:hypothetical protein
MMVLLTAGQTRGEFVMVPIAPSLQERRPNCVSRCVKERGDHEKEGARSRRAGLIKAGQGGRYPANSAL